MLGHSSTQWPLLSTTADRSPPHEDTSVETMKRQPQCLRNTDLLQRQGWARKLPGGMTSGLPPKVTQELAARRVDKAEQGEGPAAGVGDSARGGVQRASEGFPTGVGQGQTQDLQVYLSSVWGTVEEERQEATRSQAREVVQT